LGGGKNQFFHPKAGRSLFFKIWPVFFFFFFRPGGGFFGFFPPSRLDSPKRGGPRNFWRFFFAPIKKRALSEGPGPPKKKISLRERGGPPPQLWPFSIPQKKRIVRAFFGAKGKSMKKVFFFFGAPVFFFGRRFKNFFFPGGSFFWPGSPNSPLFFFFPAGELGFFYLGKNLKSGGPIFFFGGGKPGFRGT